MSFKVAIDGPAGAGKSTVARMAAEKMHLIYVDTGAMYRAMALYMLQNGIDPEDEKAVEGACENVDITIQYEGGTQVVYLNGENVNTLIRTKEAGGAASKVAVIPAVRKKLVWLQRRLAEEKDCIMDGRDIGTCVLPDADVKIYLTASSLVRAKRRYEELLQKGEVCDLSEIQRNIEERDDRDMHREISPLMKAEDACLLDTSELSLEQVLEEVIRLCGKR